MGKSFRHIPGAKVTPWGVVQKKKAAAAVEEKSKAAAAKQEELIRVQENREKQQLAEATSEVATRTAATKRSGGRSLLIKTSPTGVRNLGGT